jgi:hypothetical protein
MPSDRVPSYRRKKTKSGTYAAVTLPDGLGGCKDVLLGPWRSKESHQEYHRIVGEWEAAGRHLPKSVADAEKDLTINELVLRSWPHAEQHYRHTDQRAQRLHRQHFAWLAARQPLLLGHRHRLIVAGPDRLCSRESKKP